MWPAMMSTAEASMVRSEPSSRSAIQPPRMEHRYTVPP